MPGVQGTLTAAAVSIVLALVLGFVLGVGRLSTHTAIRWVCSVVVEFFRAVPVLIMMIFAYFLYALYDVFPSKHLALAGVITGLTLYNGAVIAEIVRAGVYALPRGQSEAAYALGLTWGQTMRSILLPQAVTSMLPVLISQLVVVLKDTAIGYVITFLEMVRQGVQLGAAYGNLLPALIVIAVLMISVNFALSYFAVWLEGRMRRSRRGAGTAARRAGRSRRARLPQARRRHDLNPGAPPDRRLPQRGWRTLRDLRGVRKEPGPRVTHATARNDRQLRTAQSSVNIAAPSTTTGHGPNGALQTLRRSRSVANSALTTSSAMFWP